jgi:hypothetical protein
MVHFISVNMKCSCHWLFCLRIVLEEILRNVSFEIFHGSNNLDCSLLCYYHVVLYVVTNVTEIFAASISYPEDRGSRLFSNVVT